MRAIIFTFLFLVSGLVKAQNFAPQGAEWYYGYNNGILPNPSYYRIESVADIIFHGKNCRHLMVFLENTFSSNEYCYEDSNKVYWYNSRIDTFTLLYDFNAQVGNSWIIQLDDTCFTEIFVDSLSYLIIGQDSLIVQHVNSNFGFANRIIQRIGSNHWLFPFEDYASAFCENFITDEGYFTGLRCYQDSIIGFYQTGYAPFCSYTGIDFNEKPIVISIFPNPANKTLNISLPNIPYLLQSISITDPSGKQILQTTQPEIPVSHLSKGLYFVRVEFTNGQSVIRKVVIQ